MYLHRNHAKRSGDKKTDSQRFSRPFHHGEPKNPPPLSLMEASTIAIEKRQSSLTTELRGTSTVPVLLSVETVGGKRGKKKERVVWGVERMRSCKHITG